MSKLETARQLAKQTAGHSQSTENSTQQNKASVRESEAEVMNFIQAVQKILNLTDGNRALLMKQAERMNQIEQKHTKEMRLMIIFLLVPMIIIAIGLAGLLIFK